MTDNARYRESVMDWEDAEEYAYSELGAPRNDVYEQQIRNMVHRSVINFIDDVSFGKKTVTGTEHDNGVVIEATLGGKIINPKKVPGIKPRFWATGDELVFYFKKENLYYLLRFEV